LISDDNRLGPMYGRGGHIAHMSPTAQMRPEDRFVRRVARAIPAAEQKVIFLFRMTENWYFTDDFGNTTESDFEDRLHAVQAWAARRAGASIWSPAEQVSYADGRRHRLGEAVAEPSWGDIKTILRDLAKIEVRPWTEMNLDVPDPLPVDRQWWNVPVSTE